MSGSEGSAVWQTGARRDILQVTAPTRPIVLIGFMGSGKSSVGRHLARDLRWPRIDIDHLVTTAMEMRIPEIFERWGEERFRDEESAALKRLEGTPLAIIVTGGGIVLRADNIDRLRALGTVVWLTATRDVLQERLARTNKRPLLQTPDPAATIARLLAEREKIYATAADHTLDTSELNHAQVAQAIRRAIEG